MPKPNKEPVLLVGSYRRAGGRVAAEESLTELAALATSAGAHVDGVFLQERRQANPGTLIGRGKIEELAQVISAGDIAAVIFDDALSPAQQRNLEREWHCKVLDRAELILDLFAQRARTREGKLQVELAQLNYRLPRLAGHSEWLSRLGGGIGTRGPGETKLETDRRVIRHRVGQIRQQIEKVRRHRGLHRSKRRAIPVPVVSLAGYTNAGKSTLFNTLTTSKTLSSDRLFATLDPLVRRLRLSTGQEVLFADTVGFIRKLPTDLVAAFRATLEEICEADLILHVVDASSEQMADQKASVESILRDIGAESTPVLVVYNKADLLSPERRRVLGEEPGAVVVSALSGEGIKVLEAAVARRVAPARIPVRLRIPYRQGFLLGRLRSTGAILNEEYTPEEILVRAEIAIADQARWAPYLDNSVAPGKARKARTNRRVE